MIKGGNEKSKGEMMKLRKAIHGIRETVRFWNNYNVYVRNGSVDEAFDDIEYLNYLLYQKNKILNYFTEKESKIYEYELSCLRRSMPYNMTCDVNDYKEKYNEIEKDLDSITFDKQTDMFFLVRNGRRLYFKKSLDTRKKVEQYYSYLAYEQTDNSPHKYDSESFSVQKNDILADCGAAEGIFGLDHIDLVDKLYLFEYEEEWIAALRQTFLPYRNKVEIIPKYLSDVVGDESCTTLDACFENDRVTFIKMDLEGHEYNVLRGGKNTLQRKDPLKLAIAVYHNKEDESKILQYLSGITENFYYEKSNGYLLHGWESAPPPVFSDWDFAYKCIVHY